MKTEKITAKELLESMDKHPDYIEVQLNGQWVELYQVANYKITGGVWDSDGKIYINNVGFQTFDYVTIRHDSPTPLVDFANMDLSPEPLLNTMMWHDVTIEFASNGWFKDLVFVGNNTLQFVDANGDVILRLSAPHEAVENRNDDEK